MMRLVKIEENGFSKMWRNFEKNYDFFNIIFKIHGMKSGSIGCYKKVCKDNFAIQKFRAIGEENKSMRVFFSNFGGFELYALSPRLRMSQSKFQIIFREKSRINLKISRTK